VSELEDQIRASLDRVLVSLSGQLEADISASSSDILRATSDAQARAVAEAAEQAAADVRREAEQQLALIQEEFERQREDSRQHAAAELAAVQQALDEVRAALSTTHTEIDERRQEHDALGLRLEERQRELEGSRRETDDVRREADDLRSEIESVRQESESHKLKVDDVEGQLEHSRREFEDARRAADQAREETLTARHETEQARRESEERLQTAEAIRRLFEEARERIELLQREREEAHRHAERSSRLVPALEALDHAATLGDVLDGLVRVASQEAGRAAVFLVNGQRLRGWRATGFTAADAIVGSELDAHEEGLLGNAVRSGRQDFHSGNGVVVPAFAATEPCGRAVALPVEVAGSVIAVLYADAATTDKPEDLQWTSRVEILTRYAGRVLEAITVRQAAEMWTPRAAARPPMGRNRSGPAPRAE